MKSKTIAMWALILTAVGVVSSWLIPMIFNSNSAKVDVKGNKNQTIQSVKADNSSMIQTGDNSKVFQNSPVTINQTIYKVEVVNSEGATQLEEELKKLTQYKHPFPDRPMIAVANASVAFVNYIDSPPYYTGLVKAGIRIPLVNIGGVDAKDVTTTWKIYDNGAYITSAAEYFGGDPLFVKELKSDNAISLGYNPEIGANGKGVLELSLEYQYTNADTGEKYSGQYNGSVKYEVEKNSTPIEIRFQNVIAE